MCCVYCLVSAWQFNYGYISYRHVLQSMAVGRFIHPEWKLLLFCYISIIYNCSVDPKSDDSGNARGTPIHPGLMWMLIYTQNVNRKTHTKTHPYDTCIAVISSSPMACGMLGGLLSILRWRGYYYTYVPCAHWTPVTTQLLYAVYGCQFAIWIT